eukprot:CAMPEP_0119314000 /NCGR_PEP_ID=MMETSP1333-20130426/31227_1 /TAXON_ID=418940 /ORGANISM="Scyphosphaera apsteinii, Strain RCC1455" /LENGTH=202 /DNA_ID=CAMNT_0007319009 /DNA_START=372 /DNA_END=980 /DNA_ORIENTATION=-
MTHPEVSWQSWAADAHNAFQTMQKQYCMGLRKAVVGYKLMYDQVPNHLIPDFLQFVAQHNITVVHLVREATILRLASHHQSSISHSNNATLVAKLHYAQWTQWRPRNIHATIEQVYLEQLIRFIGAEADTSTAVPHELIKLHEGTCSERVAQYSIIENILGNTQTAAACAMIEGRLASQSRNFLTHLPTVQGLTHLPTVVGL